MTRALIFQSLPVRRRLRWPSQASVLGVEVLGVWWMCVGSHSYALVPLPTSRQADRSIVPTLGSPCPQSLIAGLQEQPMGSSVLAGGCVAVCVKHFSGSEISAQGDSYMGFSLTFWHVKLRRCLEFSPLTAPAPQLPSEISVRHPYPLGRPSGYFLHFPSSNFSVRKFSEAWPHLLWLTRVYKAQAGSKHKGHIWLGANEPVWSFRVAFFKQN